MHLIKGWKITLAVLLLLFGLYIVIVGVIEIYYSSSLKSLYQTDSQSQEIVGQRIKEIKGESAYNEWIKSNSETEKQTTEAVKQLDELTHSLRTTGTMLLIVGLIYIISFVFLLARPLPIVALGSGIYALITLVPILMIPSSQGAIIEVIAPILIFAVSLITFFTKKTQQIKNNIYPNQQNITQA